MILTDTGPLVALIDSADSYHSVCVEAASNLPPEPMVTTWICFAEAMYILGSVGRFRYQAELWDLRRTRTLVLHSLTESEAGRMLELMERYRDTPMDLADASLVAVAESLSMNRVFTIDSDFLIYRLADGSALDVIPRRTA